MTQVSAAAVTHPGLRRESNEDAFRARPDIGLFIVADGMGGHEAGEVASGLTVEVVESFVYESRDADLNQTWPFPFDTTKTLDANRLIAAYRLANRRVASAMADNPALKGMATTVAAVLINRDAATACIAHVGDSRVYRMRDRVLQQMTQDHSWVTEQVRAGLLSDDDAHRHPWRNVVTRAISGGDDPDVDVRELPVMAGDVLLVCSDGLSSVVGLDDMQTALSSAGTQGADLEAAASALVSAANAAGGPDNITVVLVRIDV
ncbi:MAG: PP2C family serine/threonine-protein phosphatase [Vicinamibacterales bacterium]